jgi:hypothetical protein
MRPSESEWMMMRRILAFIGVFSVALIGSVASPAGATPPADVEIVVPGFEGPFVATGTAVDDGVVCGTGEVFTTYVKAAGFQSNRGVNLTVGKEFTCDDESGTFSAKLQVRIDFAQGVSFNWVITGGTDEYEDLRGVGSGFVVPVDTDVYQGGLHVD